MADKIKEKRKMALMDFKKGLLLTLGKDVLVLKLFGSQARGDFRSDSDIDVLIVLRSLSRKKKDFIMDLTTKILLEYGVDISPIIYSQKEFNYYSRLPSVFLQILKREAVQL